MFEIAIVGFDYALGTAILGLNDLLTLSGVTWNRIHRHAATPRFRVTVASADGRAICCINRLQLLPHGALDALPPPDVLIVPTIGGNLARTLELNPRIVDYLQQIDRARTLIAGNCTGVFFLAEAGLLDGKEATTHWGFADIFRQRYPKVRLKPEQMMTHCDNILCAGGGHAWFDLGLYLVERFCGHEAAVETAKSFVIDMGRKSQFSYSPLDARKQHGDAAILAVQHWIDQHASESFSLDSLAQGHGLSVRTLIRRFKKASGETPLAYTQAVRLERACKLIETRPIGIEAIAHQVGYEDVSSFSRLFKEKTGLSPSHYRERYKRFSPPLAQDGEA
ncbi:MAG TPA: helix-turn-helix domain-containing protein [Rhodocyclaceae bacterium]|nr:helix-turn-helix domain-containing protein [Rhodocyclaceae bacterium]